MPRRKSYVLMTGLAGIGYQLGRLFNPCRFPSVLMLEPFMNGSDDARTSRGKPTSTRAVRPLR